MELQTLQGQLEQEQSQAKEIHEGRKSDEEAYQVSLLSSSHQRIAIFHIARGSLIPLDSLFHELFISHLITLLTISQTLQREHEQLSTSHKKSLEEGAKSVVEATTLRAELEKAKTFSLSAEEAVKERDVREP